MDDPRKTPPTDSRLAALEAQLAENPGPPVFATLSVGEKVDEHAAASAGANPEARI